MGSDLYLCNSHDAKSFDICDSKAYRARQDVRKARMVHPSTLARFVRVRLRQGYCVADPHLSRNWHEVVGDSEQREFGFTPRLRPFTWARRIDVGACIN